MLLATAAAVMVMATVADEFERKLVSALHVLLSKAKLAAIANRLILIPPASLDVRMYVIGFTASFRLAASGVDVGALWAGICSVIVKSLVCVEGSIPNQSNRCGVTVQPSGPCVTRVYATTSHRAST